MKKQMKVGKITISMEPELAKKIKRAAMSESLSVSAWLRRLAIREINVRGTIKEVGR